MVYSTLNRIPLRQRFKSLPGLFGIRLAAEPSYRILDMEDEKEIREYPRMTLASITVLGQYDSALKEAYSRLSKYQSGENATALEMELTAPILEEQNQSSWTISIVLPHHVSPVSAPTPFDHSISISERPSQKLAAISYTGSNSLERIYAKSAELHGWLLTKPNLIPKGDVKIAHYDKPNTIKFFRRNELQLEVAEAH